MKSFKTFRPLSILLAAFAFLGTASAERVDGLSKEMIDSVLLKGRYVKSPSMVYPKPPKVKSRNNTLAVTATAYTSHVDQTDSTPNIAAWGDRLKPGMKAIAVSRDLLKKYGLKRGSRVKISGLSGYYVVLDKMNKRWRKKIDIYMGMDKKEAFRWGRKKVVIEWAS